MLRPSCVHDRPDPTRSRFELPRSGTERDKNLCEFSGIYAGSIDYPSTPEPWSPIATRPPRCRSESVITKSLVQDGWAAIFAPVAPKCQQKNGNLWLFCCVRVDLKTQR